MSIELHPCSPEHWLGWKGSSLGLGHWHLTVVRGFAVGGLYVGNSDVEIGKLADVTIVIVVVVVVVVGQPLVLQDCSLIGSPTQFLPPFSAS